MEIRELVDKWQINRAMFASRTKMVKSTFNNKLNLRNKLKFNISEKDKVINLLRLMEKDLHDCIKVNFVPGDEKEKVCPSCGSESSIFNAGEYKCQVCKETWLSIYQKEAQLL